MKSSIISVFLILAFCAASHAKTVTLSWDASPTVGVTGYKLYYKAGSSTPPLDGIGANEGNSPIDVGNVLTYIVTGLPDSDIHYFTLTAYDAAGYESSFSNIVNSPASSGGKLYIGGVGRIQVGGSGKLKLR
jgi:hypothetical protein